MSLTNAYTQAYGKLGEFFGKLRDGQVPTQFTQQLLKDLGYKSQNHRAYIPIMKAIGFLTPDGKPTARYSEYRDHSKSKFVMAEGLKEAYADIFLIKEKPTNSDKDTVQGKFKSYHNSSDVVAKHMTSTFYALLSLADLTTPQNGIDIPETAEEEKNTTAAATNQIPIHQNVAATGLHYNIQIHLPATKDAEVYNAIFKSLKEHLFES